MKLPATGSFAAIALLLLASSVCGTYAAYENFFWLTRLFNAFVAFIAFREAVAQIAFRVRHGVVRD